MDRVLYKLTSVFLDSFLVFSFGFVVVIVCFEILFLDLQKKKPFTEMSNYGIWNLVTSEIPENILLEKPKTKRKTQTLKKKKKKQNDK